MARQSWELLDWPHLCRCLLFARPITFAAREVSTMTVPLKFNPSTQPGERATGSTRTCCDGSLGPAREGSFHFVTRPLRWKRDRSLASTPGSAELTSATTIPFDELIYLPAAE